MDFRDDDSLQLMCGEPKIIVGFFKSLPIAEVKPTSFIFSSADSSFFSGQ